jgi:uncharacterized protein (TIGR04255 family)
MSPRYQNPPVFHVLAQVRFTEVLSLPNEIAGIQSNLMKAGFPFFEQQQIGSFSFSIGPNPRVAKQASSGLRFQFLDRTRTKLVLVDSNSVAFVSSDHHDFEQFAGGFRSVLDAIIEGSKRATEGALILRVGLRYTDRITPRTGEDISKYVNPSLLGFRFLGVPIREEGRSLQLTSIARTALGRLMVRSFQNEGNRILPPDLGNPPLRIRVKTPDGEKLPMNVASNRPGITLDFDHIAEFPANGETVVDFTTSETIDILTSLHEVITIAFTSATTEYAREQWGLEIGRPVGEADASH